jgi:group II intron reverse transcriptase/maturase
MFTATRLDRRESLRLNIASLYKGVIRPIQEGRLTPQAGSSMVKAVLLQVYLLGASTIGRRLAFYRPSKTNSTSKQWVELWTVTNRADIISLNVEKGQPKEDVRSDYRTSGLPKVENNYGNRGIVLPVFQYYNKGIYSSLNKEIRGRVPDLNIRSISSAAGETSTVKSDATLKLLNLAEFCKSHPHDPITEKVYRYMYDPKLFEMAYNKLKSKPGNMTPGIVPTTLDGMSREVIDQIIFGLKDQSFKFTPGRRIKIPKVAWTPKGGTRPLTIAPPRDKLVQEVMRMILEIIFEPAFSDSSHGFRTGRSCHTALKEIKETFGVATWYIEGDISKCFDSIDHEILMKIIEARIQDRRFTRLIRKALNAGYFEFREFKHSIIGTPQGSIVSPILSNIFMDKLDKFIETLKQNFDIGNKAKLNSEWTKYANRKTRSKSIDEKLFFHKKMLETPSRDPMDPSFKRLVYVRYADDWIVGIRGSLEETRQILTKITSFLKTELNLNLSPDKTLITNANLNRALFLGTKIGRAHHRTYTLGRSGYPKRNSLEIRLEAPLDRIRRKLSDTGFLKGNIPTPRFL